MRKTSKRFRKTSKKLRKTSKRFRKTSKRGGAIPFTKSWHEQRSIQSQDKARAEDKHDKQVLFNERAIAGRDATRQKEAKAAAIKADREYRQMKAEGKWDKPK